MIALSMTYVLHLFHARSNVSYSEAYKRKRLRLIELQNSNLPPVSREEHELTQEMLRIRWPR